MKDNTRGSLILGVVLATYVGTLLIGQDLHDISEQLRPVATVTPSPAPKPTPARRATRSVKRLPILEVTCYLATGNRTASGPWPRVGHAAANAYPFGTHLRVAGRTVTVVDRSAPGATDVDIFMTDRAACEEFGRQHLPVRRLP